MNQPVDHAALALSLYETACETHKRQDWRLACHALAKSLKQALASSAAMPAPAPVTVEAVQVAAPAVKAKGKAPAKAKDTSALTGANLKASLALVAAVQVKDKDKDVSDHPWNCVLISATGDSVTFRRQTPECETVATYDAPGVGTWQGGANVKDLLQGLGAGPVTLAKHNTLQGVTITQGAGSRTVLGGRPVDYPEPMSAGDMVATFDLDTRALSFVAPAMSTEATRYYLNGAYFHVTKDTADKGKARLKIVATDGHRLQVWSAPYPEGAEPLPGSIVRRETVLALLTLRHLGPIRVAFSLSHSMATAGNVTMTARHIDGSFPDYPRVIPLKNPGRIQIDSRAWGDAIAPIVRAKIKGARHVFGPSSLTISAGIAENAVEAKTDCKGPADDWQTGLNATYARDLCDTMGEAVLTIEYDDAGAPLVIRPVTEPEGVRRLSVLMPLRV